MRNTTDIRIPGAKRANVPASFSADDLAMKRRSARRRRIIVGHIAKDFADAERWDLEFWQSQTPEMRLSALVELREDLALIPGRNKAFDNQQDVRDLLKVREMRKSSKRKTTRRSDIRPVRRRGAS
jgi:hypothetical protein